MRRDGFVVTDFGGREIGFMACKAHGASRDSACHRLQRVCQGTRIIDTRAVKRDRFVSRVRLKAGQLLERGL